MSGHKDEKAETKKAKQDRIWLYTYLGDAGRAAFIGTEDEVKKSGFLERDLIPPKIALSNELQSDIQLLTRTHPLLVQDYKNALARVVAYAYECGLDQHSDFAL